MTDRAGVRAYRVFLPNNAVPNDAAPLLVELGWLPLRGDRRMPSVPRPDGAMRIAGSWYWFILALNRES